MSAMNSDTKESGATAKKRPSRMKHGPAFEFIVGSSATATQLGDARAAIRRQAARSGYRARLRGTKIQQSSTRSESENSQDELETRPGSQRGHSPSMELQRAVLTAEAFTRMQPSSSGYEAMRINYHADITALDSFTIVDFADIGHRLLTQGSLDQPGALLSDQVSSSFLGHLPARYGSVQFLDDAIHCVAARAAQMLGWSRGSSSPTELYTKALHSLRKSIQSSSLSDLHCATRLLVLYEVKITPSS
jgi:hypothetical protein